MYATGEEPPWQQARERKHKEIDNAIPAAWKVPAELLQQQQHSVTRVPHTSGIMTQRELAITEMRAVDLLSLMKSRTYTAVQVTTAFCKRAAIAHQATNCLAHILFASAIARAKELDAHLARTGQPIGPLHGLPISVKEHIYLAGTPSTSGLVAWADTISTEDALIVKIFREAGAVFHVKTTNPQTLMALETDSNLYGRTFNPYNRGLTSGGSSGGESALIAMRGSCLGVGTDIGGSIRVPSAFAGLHGLKGSVARLPHSGLSGLHGGMENIIGCVGPMTHSLADLALFCHVALASQPWRFEPSLMPMPWQPIAPSSLPKRLKIGVMWHDGMVQLHPPVYAALRHTVDVLRAAGHLIVDWDPKHQKKTFDWINKAYFLDGGDEYRSHLLPASDPPVPIVKYLLDTHATKRYTLEETWALNTEHDALRVLHAEQMRATGVDVILCPVAPSVAAGHDEARHWAYSAVWNALDLPGVVMPVRRVEEGCTYEAVGLERLELMSEMDEYYAELWKQGGAEKYRDAPTSVQLVGERLQEERLLAVAEVVEGLLVQTRTKMGVVNGDSPVADVVAPAKHSVKSVDPASSKMAPDARIEVTEVYTGQ